jgi:hypothetical protein
MINYVTDGGPSHFKNRQNILNLTFHEVDFGVPAVWSFSATSHGKGPVDGLGAALKSTATRYLLRHGPTEAFKSPKEFYEFSKQRQVSTGNPIELLYVTSDEILALHRAKNAQRWLNINGRLHAQRDLVPIFSNCFYSSARYPFIPPLCAERLAENQVSAYMGIHELPELRSLTRISCNCFRKTVCALFFLSRVRTFTVCLVK